MGRAGSERDSAVFAFSLPMRASYITARRYSPAVGSRFNPEFRVAWSSGE